MRGIRIPFVVDFISSREDALGVVVPIPTAPVDGNTFCALAVLMTMHSRAAVKTITVLLLSSVFIHFVFGSLK